MLNVLKNISTALFSAQERHIFGTDGVRGRANQGHMTPDVVLRLAQAVAQEFRRRPGHHTVVIGKDTRLSGYMIEPALTAGFISMGMDVFLVGPLPTPAIAMLTRSLRADLGVMISASHNPAEDNGVKFFGPDGCKLDDTVEARIESYFHAGATESLAPATALGRAKRLDDAQGRYIEYVKNTFPRGLRLDGLKIVVDSANGAAYKVAPAVFWELGAEVISIHSTPTGMNINQECGATHLDSLKRAVFDNKAHIGIALDGDADRIMIVDENGQAIEGDHLLAQLATSWNAKGLLRGNGVVATVMSNMGLEKYLESQNLHLIRTPVGDRYVGEYMRQNDYNVGGEQSGHIILGENSTTGDGILAGLQILATLVQEKKPASALRALYTPYPQILKNIKGLDKKTLDLPEIRDHLQKAEDSIKGKGRLLVRASGTESLVRIMLEGEDPKLLEKMSVELVTFLEKFTEKSNT